MNKRIVFSSVIILIGFTILLVGTLIFDSDKKNNEDDGKETVIDTLTEEGRIEQLTKLYDSLNDKKNVKLPTYDYLQPWLLNEFSYQDVKMYVKKLKRAGYKGIILQYPMEFEIVNNKLNVKSTWYPTMYYEDSEEKLYRPNVLDLLLKVTEENDMEIYIGLPNSSDWFKNYFNDSSWRNLVNEFINDVLEELYNRYKDYSNFKGWYYSFEMYANDANYYDIWSNMINETLTKINELDSKKEFMISVFVSNLYDIEEIEVKRDFLSFINNTNFRDNDIINMQDCLGTSNYAPDITIRYIRAISEACNDANKKIDFWLNVENYSKTAEDKFVPAYLERFILQLKISSIYVDTLASFSYSQYYFDNKIDKEYRDYYYSVTNERLTMIDTPKSGSVYEDADGDEVVLPFGFSVDDNNNIISKGLVIKDNYGNEFVWVPVKGGVKENCYTYKNDEYKTVYYSRYLNNGSKCDVVKSDSLPVGVKSDADQINKYLGFYVGRYETSFSYNNNNPLPVINRSKSVNLEFGYQFSKSENNGILWNNINYQDAKRIAEEMYKEYNYDSTIKTGLINGIEWDTLLKWIHSNDDTYNMIYDSRSWGNFNNSILPAINDNYEKNKLKPSGSNENWKVLNIYDLAGNLGEWTSETSDSKPIIRGSNYNQSGEYGVSISLISDSYQFPHIGFRIVLYVE